MDVYEVKVCKFTSVERLGEVSRLHRGEFTTHYCVVDFDKFLAIDIFTKEQFKFLQRNERTQILASENVELYKNYALYFQKLDLTKLSEKELRKIKLAYFRFGLLSKNLLTNSKKQFQKMIKR